MLLLKMVRDIRKNLSQFITILLMILLSMATYTGIEGYMQGMQRTVDRFYEKNNLQDLNIRGELSQNDIKTIQKIDNVKAVEGRLTFQGQILDLVRQGEPKTDEKNSKFAEHQLEINLISANEIAKFEISDGEKFVNEADKIWVDTYFANKNNLQVGDKVSFLYQDTPQEAQVAGLIFTPDHVYVPKNKSEIVPNYEKYGYAYLDYGSFLKKNKRTDRNLTQLVTKLYDSSKIDETKTQIQEKLGKRSVVSKIKDEPTVKVFQGEIDENVSIMGIFTSFFVLIAILSVATTMTRLIKRDRTRIDTLKALGFSSWRINWHYISYGVFLGIIGGAAGLILGTTLIAPYFLGRISQFFEIPNYRVEITAMSLVIYLAAVIIIGLTCYLVARKIVKQNATEILKPEQPKISQKELRFTTGRFFIKLNFAARWNIRDMIRNKGRVMTTLVGTAGAIALTILAFGAYSSMQNFILLETEVVNNFDLKAELNEEKIYEDSKQLVAQEIKTLKHHEIDATQLLDKKRAELRQRLEEAFVRNSEQKSIELMTDDSQIAEALNLFIDDSQGAIQFLDTDRQKTKISEDGVYLARQLAEKYNLKLGDEIGWRFAGESKVYSSRIVGILAKQQDQNLTVNKRYLESLGIKYQPNTFYLEKSEDIEENELSKYLDIQSKEAIAKNLKKMLDTMLGMLVVSLILAIFLGVVIIYNMGALSFMEQELHFATMKVLGFTNRRLSKIFTGQNILITVVAGIFGVPLGVLLTDYIYKVSVDKDYDIQTYITPIAFVVGILGTLFLSFLISKLLTVKIKKIDMVKALKIEE